MQLLSATIALLFANYAFALYGSKSDVISVDDKSFKDEVLKANGIVIVEFYAPW